MKESGGCIYYASVVISTIRFLSNKQNKLFYKFICLDSQNGPNGRYFFFTHDYVVIKKSHYAEIMH